MSPQLLKNVNPCICLPLESELSFLSKSKTLYVEVQQTHTSLALVDTGNGFFPFDLYPSL